jgi:lipopolysaccharide/colanic/teichoic acid biosynthesis glycosyltransferase
MVKRLFDIVVSTIALILWTPVFLIAAIGILLSGGPGSVFFRSPRIGKNGRPFTMHKFRTMRIGQLPDSSPITSPQDSRVFFWGAILRRLKIDELPQFYDVLRGAMSLVGPRPEDPRIVRDLYHPEDWETLQVRPGLTSPASLYDYTHGDLILAQGDPEQVYQEQLLPEKLALEKVYVRESNLIYDFQILFRTAVMILLVGLGKRRFSEPAEMAKARLLIQPARGLAEEELVSVSAKGGE